MPIVGEVTIEGLLGCPRKIGSMVRISGLFHLPINGVFLGVKSPTDPNPLESYLPGTTVHPSR